MNTKILIAGGLVIGGVMLVKTYQETRRLAGSVNAIGDTARSVNRIIDPIAGFVNEGIKKITGNWQWTGGSPSDDASKVTAGEGVGSYFADAWAAFSGDGRDTSTTIRKEVSDPNSFQFS